MDRATGKFNKDSLRYEVKMENLQLDYIICDLSRWNVSPCKSQVTKDPYYCQNHTKKLPLTFTCDKFEIMGDLFFTYVKKFQYGHYSYEYRVILYNVKNYQIKYKHSGKDWIPSTGYNFSIKNTEPTNLDLFLEIEMHEKIEFEPTSMPIKIPDGITQMKLNFTSLISSDVINQISQEKNFSIDCNSEIFYFNKTLLSLTSEVFFKMIHGTNKETETNSVKIDDFTPETIKTFQNMAFGNEISNNEDLTPELLLFSQKYFIKPLIAKCVYHLMKTLTEENVFEVVKIAYLIDEENLLKTASKFLKQNRNKMIKTEEWRNFEKSHPDCMIRMYRLMFENY